MAITVTQIVNTNSFGAVVQKTNQLLAVLNANAVTADTSTTGSVTVGNVQVQGSLSSLTLAANSLGGGNVATSANLTITSNVVFSNGPYQYASMLANTTSSNVNFAVNSFSISNTTIITGNLQFSNSLNVNTVITANTVNAVNMTLTGNLTLGGNANVAGNLYVTGYLVTLSQLNAANSIIPTLNGLFNIGNSTFTWVNTYSTNFIGNTIALGNSTVNASINTTAYTGSANNATNFAGQGQAYYANVTSPTFSANVSVGANVYVNTTTIFIGNTTVFSTINSTSYLGSALTANNSTNFAGQGQIYYANSTYFGGVVNASTINASSTVGLASNTFANGIYSGLGTPAGQLVLTKTNYGVIFRNDDTNFQILYTATGNQYGTWSTLRPYSIALSSGAVTIDGTGSGVTMGGGLTVGNTTLTTTGITVTTNSASAIIAKSNGTVTITATANGATAISGTSNGGSGVTGTSNTANGIYGTSNSGYAVYGLSNTNYGVFGYSNTGTGVQAISNTATGIIGSTYANSGGYGGYFTANGTSTGIYALSNTGTVAQFSNGTTTLATVDGNANFNVLQGSANVAANVNANNINALSSVISGTFVLSPQVPYITIQANTTLTNAHLGYVLLVNCGAPINLTVPNTFVAGDKLLVTCWYTGGTTGGVTLVPAANVSLNSRTGNYSILNRYGSISLFCPFGVVSGTNYYVVDGNI